MAVERAKTSKEKQKKAAVLDQTRRFAPLLEQIPATFAPDRVAVECQAIYPGGRYKDDLLDLANVSGAAACAVAARFPDALVFMPLPREWKGQVPKPIHHKRVRAKLENPEVFDKLTEDERDAVALAVWAQTGQID